MSKSKIIRVYKSAGNFIIELKINILTAKTNFNRQVFDKNFAKYKCNEASIVIIYDKITGHEIDAIKSDYDPKFIYKKGEIIKVPDYNDEICGKGIHFYLTMKAAFFHDLDITGYNGTYYEYYNDGRLREKCYYKNSKKEGLSEIWYRDGQLRERCRYINDKREGLCEIWYDNGHIYKKYNYLNDYLEGLCQVWYRNKQQYVEYYYVEGIIKNSFEKWYKF